MENETVRTKTRARILEVFMVSFLKICWLMNGKMTKIGYSKRG